MNGLAWLWMENRQKAASKVYSQQNKIFADQRYGDAAKEAKLPLSLYLDFWGGPYFIVWADCDPPNRQAELRCSFQKPYLLSIQAKLKRYYNMTSVVSEVDANQKIPINEILDMITYKSVDFNDRVKLDLLPPKSVDGKF
jgi:hypothetical protein